MGDTSSQMFDRSVTSVLCGRRHDSVGRDPLRGSTAMNARLTRRMAAAAAAATALATLSACGNGDDSAPATAGSVSVAGVKIKKDQALHDALPGTIKKAGTVRVATDVPYPPFEMFVKEGDKELTGLDYDLGQALGGKLGVRFVFTPQKFDGIVPAIQAGKFDAAMSAIT